MSNTTSNVNIPVYFETSWSILSSLSLVNVLIGFLVIGITSLTPVTLVPIVVSAAAATADGLCYYAFYQQNARISTAVAAVAADLLWGIQEAGLSFYSYIILIKILHGRNRRLFIALYWTGIFIVSVFKIAITVLRLQDILGNTLSHILLIDRMHIGYFVGIALVEILSSYFLLKRFLRAQQTSTELAHRGSGGGLFSYLMRSTEIRLMILTVIGLTRSITYSFQTTAQSATSVSGEVDRFVVVLECMFPIVMFIDILSAKTFAGGGNSHSDHAYPAGGKSRGQVPHLSRRHHDSQVAGREFDIYSMSNMNTKINGPAHSDSRERTSSQERIVGGERENIDHNSDGIISVHCGINKTTEFRLEEGRYPHSPI